MKVLVIHFGRLDYAYNKKHSRFCNKFYKHLYQIVNNNGTCERNKKK